MPDMDQELLQYFSARQEGQEPAPPPPAAPARPTVDEPILDESDLLEPLANAPRDEPEPVAEPAEPATEPAAEPKASPEDVITRLQAEVAELRQSRFAGPSPEVAEMMARQQAIEERLAKEADDRLESEIGVLRRARERLVEDRDSFDLAQYDRIVQRQQELETQRARQQAERQYYAQQRPQMNAAQSREMNFVSQHSINQREYQAMVAAEQLMVYRDPKLGQIAPEERWKLVLAEVRRGAEPAKPAAQRPAPRHGATLPSGGSASGEAAPSLTAEEERQLRGLLGARYYTKERAGAIKAASRRSDG